MLRVAQGSRQPLWTTASLEQPATELEPFTSISDGTASGNGAIGFCQISGSAPCPTLVRVHAGDAPYEAEFAGLIFSLEALVAAKAPADQGDIYSDASRH